MADTTSPLLNGISGPSARLGAKVSDLTTANQAGVWTNAGIWDSGIPTAASNVVINARGTVRVQRTATINSISVAKGSALLIQPTAKKFYITNVNDSEITNNGAIIANADIVTHGIINNSGTIKLGPDGGAVLSLNPNGGASGDLTLKGGGAVELGHKFARRAVAGNIGSGYDVTFTNYDNKIIGIGSIYVNNLVNGSADKIAASTAKITATQGKDHIKLTIDTGSTTNYGQLNVQYSAIMELGSKGNYRSLSNFGSVNIGSDGGTAKFDKATLAIEGNYTLNGPGTVNMVGSNSRIASDGEAPEDGLSGDVYLTNAAGSTIYMKSSSVIGDTGLNYADNYLSFINQGKVIATGSAAAGVIDTGSNYVLDDGGLLEAANKGSLTLNSEVRTGQRYLINEAVKVGGVIEATTKGKVTINKRVWSGLETVAGTQIAPGQVIADSGSAVTIGKGGSVEIPVLIQGGTVTQLAGGSLKGSVAFKAGGTLNLNGNSSDVAVSGDNGHIHVTGAKSTTISDLGSGTDLYVDRGVGALKLSNFQNDAGAIIHLLNGVGGFASASDVLAAAKSDGNGGTMLSLPGGDSVDFIGVKSLASFTFKFA